ncbi:MAG: extracellular solute-binding protein [Treponema sp.]|jgi:putative aldouronate transport system substrate-binding protein|nr:extracellular solute-binding protein [Treponema sp.]
MKKVLSVMGMVTLVCAALFASGGTQQSGRSQQPSGTSTTGQAVQKEAITDAVLNQLGLEKSGSTYRFKQTKSITVEVFDRGLDGGKSKPEDNFYTNWIKAGMLRDHNIAITFKPVGRWTEIDELNNLLAAGTAPDVCVTYNYPTIQAYANMGGVLDLNPYINQYVDLFPNIWGWLGNEFINYDQNPNTHQLWALEGRISNDAGQNVFVRSDWLKKLNMPEPTTLDEFYTMLRAFRDNAQLLLGNDAHMMTPFIMGQDVGWQARNLIVSFLPDTMNDRDWFIYGFDDRHLGRPGSVPNEIAVKSAMRVLNKWYNENLVWKDFALYGSGDTTQDNLTKSGYVGAFMQNWDMPYRDGKNGITAALHTNVGPDANFIAVHSFPNNAGRNVQVSGPLVDRKVFFPSSNKEPLASLFYLDWIHKQENLFYLQFGDAGVTHQVMPNGAVQGIATTGEKIINSPNNIDYTTLINGIRMPTEDLKIKSMVLAYSEVDASIVEQAYARASAPRNSFGNANAGAIDSEEGMGQVLDNKRDAIYAKAISASVSQFDSVFDSGYRDWLGSGAQAIMNERSAKWKEYYGDKTSVD